MFIDVDVAVGRGLSLSKVAKLREAITAAVQAEMAEAEVSVTTHPLALDDETVRQRALIIAANHGTYVHHVTAHQFEDRLSISFDLEVEGGLSIQKAHMIASALEADMRNEFGQSTEVETHIEPMQDHALAGSDVDAATLETIRMALERLTSDDGALKQVHNIRVRHTRLGLIVIFHCRTAPERTVADVHKLVDDLERRLRAAVPGIWRTVAHTEPLGG